MSRQTPSLLSGVCGVCTPRPRGCLSYTSGLEGGWRLPPLLSCRFCLKELLYLFLRLLPRETTAISGCIYTRAVSSLNGIKTGASLAFSAAELSTPCCLGGTAAASCSWLQLVAVATASSGPVWELVIGAACS